RGVELAEQNSLLRSGCVRRIKIRCSFIRHEESAMPQDLRTFMNTPLAFFEQSVTKMHSIPRVELEELQRQAMVVRFAEHRERIEMVRKLAERLDTKSVREFDDVVPLFFAHTAYKSYPASLLDGKRYDLLTRWLDKLTTIDLSKADVSDCESIDEWLE